MGTAAFCLRNLVMEHINKYAARVSAITSFLGDPRGATTVSLRRFDVLLDEGSISLLSELLSDLLDTMPFKFEGALFVCLMGTCCCTTRRLRTD